MSILKPDVSKQHSNQLVASVSTLFARRYVVRTTSTAAHRDIRVTQPHRSVIQARMPSTVPRCRGASTPLPHPWKVIQRDLLFVKLTSFLTAFRHKLTVTLSQAAFLCKLTLSLSAFLFKLALSLIAFKATFVSCPYLWQPSFASWPYLW